jgi:putative phosphonate metabolism protein
MRTVRYALYYAPPEDSALRAFGRRWIGRDGGSGHECGLPGFSRARLDVLTASSRIYGFHATLKAPFRLHTSPEALRAAVEAFAGRRAPVQAPPLRLCAIHGFLALMPGGPAPAADRLAADCVRAFEPYRAPPTHAEAAHRRAAGLSLSQSALLARWGYPYVMAQFRFHLTLTDRIADSAERMAVMQRILPLVARFRSAPLHIEQICLYRQDEPGQAFVIEERYPLRGAC